MSFEKKVFGVLGDTHLPGSSGVRRLWDRWITRGVQWEDLLREIQRIWGSVDGIFHTGDLAHPYVLESLREFFQVPVAAVRGNADRGGWALALPLIHTETILGKRITVIHGWGSPRYLVDRIAHRIGWGNSEVVLFGHSHLPFLQRIEGTLWLNPGSPTDRYFAPYRSVGRLVVTPQGVEGEILRIAVDPDQPPTR